MYMAGPSYPPAPQGSTRGPSKKAAKYTHAAPVGPTNLNMSTTKPTLPPLNRSGSKRPRPSDSSFTTTDADEPPPSTTVRKKAGMRTVPATPMRKPSTIGGDDSAFKRGMYLTFIGDAFKRRSQGQDDRYNELMAQFLAIIPSTSSAHLIGTSSATASTSTSSSSDANNTASLRVWLDALTHLVSKLDITHAPLVETILAVPWATMDDSFVSVYVKFIGALVSARPEWLKAVLSPCVQGFNYRSKYTVGSTAAMPSMTRNILYHRLHSMLTMLMSLIPTLSPSLSPLLSIHFPAKREPKVAQICYIENLLTLSEYFPALTEDIMGLIVERALNIDVEIQGEPDDWEDAEEELLASQPREELANIKDVVDRLIADDDGNSSDDEDDDEGGSGGLGLEDFDSDDEPNPISDDEAAKKARTAEGMSLEAMRKVLERRTKLDAILKVVLDHLADIHTDSPPSPTPESAGSTETTPTPETRPAKDVVDRRIALFRSLLDIFDRTLLRTFKTRNTQFIIFYLCSLDVSSSDQFIGVLLGRALFETDAPAITRVAAAGYVASFVSRAKFVDANMARKVVHHLCRYLETAMEDFAAASAVLTGPRGSSTPSAAIDLPVFYAVTQAVFYIFCFRWKDLMDEGEEDDLVLEPGRRWMLGLETIKKVVASTFNPLKVCAQPIVQQFATIANKTNFLYCWSLIDSNRRSGARDNATTTTTSSLVVPPHLNRKAPAPPARSSSVASIPSAAPRQLLVAEEMDSFFPFDPFKLPLSSMYIDDIYREWTDDEASSSETSSDTSSSEASDSEDSASDLDPSEAMNKNGWNVPGGLLSTTNSDPAFDAEVARSFEAMSLSLSPQHESFGGRRKKEEDRRPQISSLT